MTLKKFLTEFSERPLTIDGVTLVPMLWRVYQLTENGPLKLLTGNNPSFKFESLNPYTYIVMGVKKPNELDLC